MATEKPNYKNWQELPLDESEIKEVERAQQNLAQTLKDAGYPEYAQKSLKLEFAKACLTIDAEEARTGAGHSLADGKPFYRMRLTAEGASIDQPSAGLHIIFMLSQIVDSCNISLDEPLTLDHDFRSPITKIGDGLANVLRHVAPKVLAAEPKL